MTRGDVLGLADDAPASCAARARKAASSASAAGSPRRSRRRSTRPMAWAAIRRRPPRARAARRRRAPRRAGRPARRGPWRSRRDTRPRRRRPSRWVRPASGARLRPASEVRIALSPGSTWWRCMSGTIAIGVASVRAGSTTTTVVAVAPYASHHARWKAHREGCRPRGPPGEVVPLPSPIESKERRMATASAVEVRPRAAGGPASAREGTRRSPDRQAPRRGW